MNRNRRCLVLGAGTVVAASAFTLGGCASEGPVKPAGLEQKIQAARTRADHQEIAAIYEKQAGVDKEAIERHRNLARAYERGWVWTDPRDHGFSARKVNFTLAAHCEKLARIYQQAVDENLALAKEHRRLAAEMKD